MAISVQMHKDLRKRKQKFIGPLSFRETICLLLAIPVATFAFNLLSFIEDISIKVIVSFLVSFPIILCGFISKDGQYFETIIVRWIYKMFLTPSIRKKKMISYTSLRKKAKQDELNERIRKMTPKERKIYEKTHKKGTKPMNYKVSKPGNKIYR